MSIDSSSPRSNEAARSDFQDQLPSASGLYADLATEIGHDLANKLFERNGLKVPGKESTEADQPREPTENSAQKTWESSNRRVEERSGESIDWTRCTPDESEIKRLSCGGGKHRLHIL